MPHSAGSEWPVRVDQHLEPGVQEADVQWVQSACVLCSNGCGMDIAVHDGRIVGVRGRESDRVNHGRLGPGTPVSKQPVFKCAAVRVSKLADASETADVGVKVGQRS
jgi:anaerobic selenocysteine-containing dehydrogenase